MRWLLLVFLLFAGCEEYPKTTSYPSPDQSYVVDVTEGYQAANDPEVWWQYVSLRRADEPAAKGRGNFLRYSNSAGSTAPVVKWTDPKTLEITAREVGYTFEEIRRSRILDEITLKLTVERPPENRAAP